MDGKGKRDLPKTNLKYRFMKQFLLFALMVTLTMVYACRKDSYMPADMAASIDGVSDRGDSLGHHCDSLHLDTLGHHHPDSLGHHHPDSLDHPPFDSIGHHGGHHGGNHGGGHGNHHGGN